jgi:hypothetical protein
LNLQRPFKNDDWRFIDLLVLHQCLLL